MRMYSWLVALSERVLEFCYNITIQLFTSFVSNAGVITTNYLP